MNGLVRAFWLVVVALALAGCLATPASRQSPGVPASGEATEPDGTGAGSQQSPAVPATGEAAEPDGPGGGPSIDWDHPFRAEGLTNVDPAALATAPQSFGTSIRPVTPLLSGGKLRWVDVSAAGTVAYMFDFSGGAAFPTDGRVTVEESQSDMTQDELISANWAGTTNSLTPVGPITILVRSYKGLSDASFVHNGTLYDISGPALGSAPALDIATQIAKQLT